MSSTEVDEGGRDRWAAERAYFDDQAERKRESLAPFSEDVMVRYATWRRAHHSKEFRFRVLGELRGKRVLDVGCGDGTNAVIMARLGARVTGVDISEGAIELARERASINGVGTSIDFCCAPLELFDSRGASFDVVWCDAFLHHVIPVLDETLARLVAWVRPGGILVAAEPVNLAQWLRRLRLLHTFIPVAGTPDERPLDVGELQRILENYPWLGVRYFQMLGRLNRLLARGRVLEEMHPVERSMVEGIARIDRAMLRVRSPLQRLASTVVLYGVRPK